jgi:hypothetical protein
VAATCVANATRFPRGTIVPATSLCSTNDMCLMMTVAGAATSTAGRKELEKYVLATMRLEGRVTASDVTSCT